jgi:hypothetical protein
MTLHDPKRATTVKIAAQPKSSAYERARIGPLAISALQLEETSSSVSSRKDRGEIQQSLADVRVPQWYLSTRVLLERHFEYQEPLLACAADLSISTYDAESIIRQAISIGEHKIGLKFRYARNSNAKYPRTPKESRIKLLAEKIALRLDALARANSSQIEEAVLTYVSRVQTTNRIMFTNLAQAPGLRKWLDLVCKLRVENHSIRPIGFLVKGERGNLHEKLKLLNLSRATEIHWVNAPNQNSRSALNYLGIDVICRLKRGPNPIDLSSEAFRYVMAIAAIAQIWRLPKDQDPKTVPSTRHNRYSIAASSLDQASLFPEF